MAGKQSRCQNSARVDRLALTGSHARIVNGGLLLAAAGVRVVGLRCTSRSRQFRKQINLGSALGRAYRCGYELMPRPFSQVVLAPE